MALQLSRPAKPKPDDGADTIMGGAGKDYIFGSDAGALLYRSAVSEADEKPPVADGAEITRGFAWVTFQPPGVDANGNEVFIVKGPYPYPYTDYTDKGNVIDAGAGDDWVSAGWANDSVHGGDDNDVIHGLAGNDVIFGDGIDAESHLNTVFGSLHNIRGVHPANADAINEGAFACAV